MRSKPRSRLLHQDCLYATSIVAWGSGRARPSVTDFPNWREKAARGLMGQTASDCIGASCGMTDRGIRRGHAICVKDGAEYIGLGTNYGVPARFVVTFNGLIDGKPSVEVSAEDAPVLPGEPVPEWMRETRAQLGLEAPRRALPKKLVDDGYPF